MLTFVTFKEINSVYLCRNQIKRYIANYRYHHFNQPTVYEIQQATALFTFLSEYVHYS